jgi:DNA-directed RNA polymerase subunit RPC12/RpoP
VIYGIDYTTRTMSGGPDPSAKGEPFHCGSCGQPVPDLKACVWDSSIQVGSCRETYIDNQCPDCGSDNPTFLTKNDPEYDEAICQDCGFRGNVESDFEVRIAPFKLTSPTLMPRLKPITTKVLYPNRKEIA